VPRLDSANSALASTVNAALTIVMAGLLPFLLTAAAVQLPAAVAVRASATVEIVAAESNSPEQGEQRVMRQVRKVPDGYLIEFS
jgi:hypothetical protein